MGLNDRQIRAVMYVKVNGKITNNEYQKLTGASDRTALRDLKQLVRVKVFIKEGEKKGTIYKIKNDG